MEKLAVARLGRSVGLKGHMRFFNLSDFPEQFQKGAMFPSDRGMLTIEALDLERGTIKFEGIDTPEEAKKLTNAYLYSSEEETKKHIELQEGEYFWFDIIGAKVYENGILVGKVTEIQRLPASDYLVVVTSKELQEKGLAKSFLLPFIDEFIQDVNIQKKEIVAKRAKEILEAS